MSLQNPKFDPEEVFYKFKEWLLKVNQMLRDSLNSTSLKAELKIDNVFSISTLTSYFSVGHYKSSTTMDDIINLLSLWEGVNLIKKNKGTINTIFGMYHEYTFVGEINESQGNSTLD